LAGARRKTGLPPAIAAPGPVRRSRAGQNIAIHKFGALQKVERRLDEI
jgi:hypothetical protein